MLPRTLRSPFCSILAIAFALLAVPAVAGAADPAAVTITACKTDAVTLAGKVTLTGKAARKARGATLQMRFQLMSLFGLPHVAEWKTVGKKRRASGQQVFTGLGADNWIGVLSFRYKKGSRTVLSDTVRSQPVKVGRSKGRANCTLAEGLKPADTTPPQLFILPADDLWHRGSADAPASVQLFADDDFSGVKSVQYQLDGGPVTQVPNRGTFGIATEGAHQVAWSATDVAGNTAQRTATVKVDTGAPTKPVVTSPASVTANRTPTISWSASSDSGSGMRGYVVTITRADGSVVSTTGVDANTTSITAPTLDDNQSYTATVTAVDNTSGQPWATNSDPYTFTVDTNAQVASVTPAAGTVLAGSARSGKITLDLDRPADSTTVSSGVKFTRNAESTSGSMPTIAIGCAASPCTQITVQPSGPLPEGRYTLTVTSDLRSGNGESTPFTAFTAAYAVPMTTNTDNVHPGGNCLNNVSTVTVTDPPSVKVISPEQATLGFDFNYGSGTGWDVKVISGANTEITPSATSHVGDSGPGHATVTFTLPASNATLSFQFTSKCSGVSSGTLDITSILATRTP